MSRPEGSRKVNSMILLFTITYMVSYITRINFGAVITEMTAQTGMTKSMLSAAVTGSAVTYGLGQLLSGYAGDRISPKRLVFLGLSVAAVMNFLILFCTSHIQLTAVWCVNGLAQAFLWPPMVKLMADMFSEHDYKRATTMVSWGSSFGTIVVYLGAPLIIVLSGWRGVFAAAFLAGAVMAFVWQKCCNEPGRGEEKQREAEASGEKLSVKAVLPLVALIMMGIILQGALRDGVTTWMPSYISETYHLGSAVSILTGVALPVFSIVSVRLACAIYEKGKGNPVKYGGLIFGAGALSALVLTFVSGYSAVASVLCFALLIGCMYAVNLMLISMVPPFFQKYGKISTVSGLLNSCTYIGSALSTYGIALLSEQAGWKTTAFVWFLIALSGTVVCLLGSHIWDRKMGQTQ